MTYTEVESILQTYTLEEIFELNNLTEEEILYFLIEQEFVELPKIMPVDTNVKTSDQS